MTNKELQQAIEKLKDLWITSQNSEAKTFAFELLKNQAIQNDQESVAKVYNLLGSIYQSLSDYPEALEYYSKSLFINEELQNKLGIATNIGNIGVVYYRISDYSKALEYFTKSLHIDEEIGNKEGIARHHGNIGTVYGFLSNYSKAIECFSRALNFNEEIGNKLGIASNLGNIGSIYLSLSDYTKAIEYFSKALHINEVIGNKLGVAQIQGNIGSIYSNLSDYTKAIEYFSKALHINEEIGNKLGVAQIQGNIGSIYSNLSDYTKAIEYFSKALQINKEIGNKDGLAIVHNNIGVVYSTKQSTFYDAKKAEEYLLKSLTFAKEIENKVEILKTYLTLASLSANEKLFENAFEYQTKSIALEKEILSAESKKQADNFHIQRKLAEQEIQIAEERGRLLGRESILRNILPDSVTDRLVKGENPIADHFQKVSVLFMDLVGFTSLASITPPKQLVHLLDSIFFKADSIVETFGLEKIKTIGDGYLAVANVTTSLEEHQKATALAALKLLETMKNFTVNIPTDLGNTDWTMNMKEIQVRIGIHTGEVVAGIIGKNKYTYDLWGDAVNVASRMESYSEPGRIHISEQFAKSIEHNSEFVLIPRGEITIKGKGTMNTFWLEKRKIKQQRSQKERH